MIRYNSRHANNGRTDGRNETGIPIGEFFASFGTMQEQGLHHFNPSGEIPVSDPSNPLQPNWQLAVANGSLGRIHGLIKSSYCSIEPSFDKDGRSSLGALLRSLWYLPFQTAGR